MILTSSFPALAGVLKLCRICGWFRLSISWVILLSLAASAASRFKEERTLWTRSVRGECWEKVARKSLTFSLRSSTRSSTGAGSPSPMGGFTSCASEEAFCGLLPDGPACFTTVVWACPATGIELTSCSPQFGSYEEVSVSLTRTLSSHDSLDREECTSEDKTKKKNKPCSDVVKRADCYSATPQ